MWCTLSIILVRVVQRTGDDLAPALGMMFDDPSNETVFVTQWWATTADIEYYSRHANVFTRYTELEPRKPFTVVYNRRFANLQDESFARLLENCEDPADPASSHVVRHSKLLRSASMGAESE